MKKVDEYIVCITEALTSDFVTSKAVHARCGKHNQNWTLRMRDVVSTIKFGHCACAM